MKKIFLLLSAFALVSSMVTAQPVSGIPTSEKQKEAAEQLTGTNYNQAVKWAEEVRKKLPEDMKSLAIIAESEMLMRDYAKAEIAYKELLEKDKKDQKYQETRFDYARVLKKMGKYADAKTQFESYSKYGADANKKALAAIEMKGIDLAATAKKNDKIIVKNAGTSVNTPQSEFGAVYVGSDMYYSSLNADAIIKLGSDGKPTDAKQEQYVKLYKSTKSGEAWGKGTALSSAINKMGINNVHVSLSEDGKSLYFSRCELKGNQSSCDVYVSTNTDGNWSDARKIEGGVNSDDFSSKQPAVGKINGKDAIFFASNMSGGSGGFDIYYAVRQEGEKFSTPVNVGPSVNTIADDQTPFYKDDMLYFSSEGHPSLGGFDVFSATQNGVTWANVKNLGADVNSSVDEMYYTLDKTGYVASFVSNRNSENSLKSATCCDDIYTVNYPIPVIIDLEVLAFNTNGGELKGVTIKIVEAGKEDAQTNERSNFFSWKDLKKNTDYKLIASKNGYESVEQSFSTASVSQTITLKEQMKLKEILVANLAVTIIDTKGQKVNGATVVLTPAGGSADSKTNKESNLFSWENLTKGATYTVKADYLDWAGSSATFTVPNENTTIKKTLTLEEPILATPLAPIVLKSINFDLAKWAIRDDAKPQLDLLAQLLIDFPAITKVELSAHTDSRGNNPANLALSQKRAASTIAYLASKGVDPSRMISVGKGETELKNDCADGVKCTEEEHEVNRRVEFKILEGPNRIPASYILK